MTAAPTGPRPDYGLDAPGVVRNLFLAGAAGLAVGAAASFGLIPAAFTGAGYAIGTTLTATGAFMVYTSRVGKLRTREKLLDRVKWTGGERVLDVGCGRGLMLVGAAKRLSTGKATGIDIWQAEDLSGNKPEATLENARREGVADRVEVTTADMRKTPFADGTFDVVVSVAAIHNLYQPAERADAIREIARVLKRGGVAVIRDIRHIDQYAREFAAAGCDVTRLSSRLATVLGAVLTFGSLRPGTLLARKGG